MDAAALQRLSAAFEAAIAARRLPGAVLYVAQHGETRCFDALGWQDAAAGVPMRRDAIFRIYSMTKPIVSLATLMLVEEGRLTLGDPVARYLPEFGTQQVAVAQGDALRLAPAQRGMAVQDLLRHTSGLTYEFLGNDPVQRLYREVDIASRARSNRDMCRLLATLPLARQPGAAWLYSRSTDVLGAVLEVVSGMSLGELLRQRIFEPLGMRDTGFYVPPEQQHRIAEPFAVDPDSGAAVELIDVRSAPVGESGGGGLVSTAADYARWLQLMLNGGQLDGVRLVSRKTLEWMTADHLGAIPIEGDLLAPGHGFGLGVAMRTVPGLAPTPGSVGMYHWSGIGGTTFFVDPREGLYAMLLAQAPGQRVHYRTLLRNLVYAALD
ncbi:class A beta-lactamase-related serine hydrolase [Hylemonella gracilis]|jgi:CubicO group peptidase (beta-lactamase class C family)|uniref:Class A beta-lactamase-related serine hydrolase n=1 Tax=Hylemonella gracilis TaxID=80880 RepID=A0A4P6UPE4_9BURK|nr:serine hydrolase domain-containing protein [Hylemonella gracilis]QBK06170.1 class A beta-lactamase-related serine hydrolase [Hylemonella gracilis]